MSEIQITRQADNSLINELGITSWPIWSHEAADFPWFYGEAETCYFLEGKVTVIPENGESVDMEKGDLVTFPKNMQCRWIIHEAVSKHYQFASTEA